jgi:hypothetical protein
MTEKEIESKLELPIPFHWRIQREVKGSGICMAYLDARDVMDRLDDVVGIANWQDKTRPVLEVPGLFISEISIKIDGAWITKTDVGQIKFAMLQEQLQFANKGEEWKVINQFPDAGKTASSDAFKRAAVKWKIGRFCYSMREQWVKIENGNVIDAFGNKIGYKTDHKKLSEYINNKLSLDEMPKALIKACREATTPPELQEIAAMQKHLFKNENFTGFIKKLKESFGDPKDI